MIRKLETEQIDPKQLAADKWKILEELTNAEVMQANPKSRIQKRKNT